MDLIVNLVSGFLGANVLGALFRGNRLVRSVLGLVGGGIGHFIGPDILSKVGALAESGDLGQAGASAGLGGILGAIGSKFAKQKGGGT